MTEKVELLFLREEEMIEAGVLDMASCVKVMEEMFELMGRKDYILGGPNRNEHGLMLWFNEEEPHKNMPVAGPDRRFMSLISYLGGRFNVMGNKWYGSNIENQKKNLPRSIHTFTLNDKDTGAPLSIMAGNLVSSMRTGAIPGVAARHLAKKDAKVMGAVGGGAINQSCIDAISTTVNSIEKIILFDINEEKGKVIAEKISGKTGRPVEVVTDIESCISESDILTVATSGAVKPVIDDKLLKPGALVLLTGAADLSEEAYNNNRIVADLWSMHKSWMNDGLEHPDGLASIRSWAMSGELLELVHEGKYDPSKVDDIGDIVSGERAGRQSEDEIIIAIMGGLPTADVAWGYQVYENALKKDLGIRLPLWEKSHLV